MISKLRLICEDLASESDIRRIIKKVAFNACYSGKSSRLYFGLIQHDFRIEQIASYGLHSKRTADFYEVNLIPSVREDIARANSINFVEHDSYYLDLFREHTGIEELSIWRTSVLMPLIPSHYAVLSLQVAQEDALDHVDYFNTLRAIFQLYFRNDGKSAKFLIRKEDSREKLAGRRLTERQELIFELIHKGLTNVAIGNRLGYSESLIRQESILIYKKMGIKGRKEIKMRRKS